MERAIDTRITGEGLVAVIGWGIEDFESAVRKAPESALLRAREILATSEPDEDALVRQKSEYGVRFIDGELIERRS